jgi:hypothetical protein
MKATMIDPAELEQREVMRRNAIANAAMEIAKAFAGSNREGIDGVFCAQQGLVAAEQIFNYVNPPVAARLQ